MPAALGVALAVPVAAQAAKLWDANFEEGLKIGQQLPTVRELAVELRHQPFGLSHLRHIRARADHAGESVVIDQGATGAREDVVARAHRSPRAVLMVTATVSITVASSFALSVVGASWWCTDE